MHKSTEKGEFGGKMENARYILITQCLQNDFFLNAQSKLLLSEAGIEKILIGGKNGREKPRIDAKKRDRSQKLVRGENGPLGIFLKSIIQGKRGKGTLHIINIRDWHAPGPSYDKERRKYGPHCEKGSWGADYIYGLEKYLDPGRTSKLGTASSEGKYYKSERVRIYHVHSDSVFDFKPRTEKAHTEHSKYQVSLLESILDILIQGSEDNVSELAEIYEQNSISDLSYRKVYELARKVDKASEAIELTVYAAVIGVYTDIKIKTLLTDLQSRYDIPNLAVSDTLTGSKSLERHLGALDFAQKVLGVEVIHGLNNLIDFLGGGPQIANESEIVTADPFSGYVTFFQDKQNVLAYENRKLREYMSLTEKKSENVYRSIENANKFLIWWGMIFLTLTLAGALMSAVWPNRFDWKLPLVTGGLSLLQLVTAFFRRPMADMLDNLTNLAKFRMILENHSFKKALARFHLTTPQTLREEIDPSIASNQVKALEEQLRAFEIIEKSDLGALKDLGFGADETVSESTNQEGGASSEPEQNATTG